MKVNFYEVDSLKKGLRKIRRKNRYRLSRKEKRQLKKLSVFLDSLKDLKTMKKHSLKRVVDRILKYAVKLFV